MAEYLTAPYLFNQVANLKSYADDRLRKLKIDFEIQKSKILSKFKEQIPTGKRVYKTDLEDLLLQDEDYQLLQYQLSEAEMDCSVMENLYWAVKEKCKKLDAIFSLVKPEEDSVELVEAQMNRVLKKFKKKI